jgi:hypothetical protein
MIVISVLGLDQFVVGTYSRKNTANLANLFECEEEEIVFYSPNSMIFHKGVEQTSWQTEILVRFRSMSWIARPFTIIFPLLQFPEEIKWTANEKH